MRKAPFVSACIPALRLGSAVSQSTILFSKFASSPTREVEAGHRRSGEDRHAGQEDTGDPGSLTGNMNHGPLSYINSCHIADIRLTQAANAVCEEAPTHAHREDAILQPIQRIPAVARLALVVTLLLGAAVTAPATRAADLIPVRVANFQNVVVLPLFHGIDKGYFKEAGLDVQIVKVATGAASVSAVAANQADIGWAAATVPMFARSNSVLVKIFMTADQEGPPDHYGSFIDVTGRSGVTSFAQLKGKTVMINAFGTAGELSIRDRLQQAGVTWDDVKKVVVPFPQMPAAFELGNADAVVPIQPMQAAIMANKAIAAKVLASGNLSVSSTQVVTASCYFATDSWLADNEKAALAFGRAYLRAQKEIHADLALRLALVMKISGMERATAETIPEAWFNDLAIKKEAVAPIYDALIRTGMMTKTFPVDDVVATLPF